MTLDLNSLKRLAWGVRTVFALGIAASLAGNVLHAADNPVSKAISAWSPLALLLTVELISRIPARRGAMSAIRLAAAAVIAGIAAWVSYWHMVAVATHYGETGSSAYLLPFSVDGLIVVASICLVEIGGRVRALNVDDAPATSLAQPQRSLRGLFSGLTAGLISAEDGGGWVTPESGTPAAPEAQAEPTAKPVKKAPAKRITPRPASAEKVAKVAAKMPGAPVAQIAAKAGVSPSTVRRHLAALSATDASPTAAVPAETRALIAA